MPRTAIIDNPTGSLLVLDPAADVEGNAILPEGIDSRAVTLTDVESAKLEQPGTYTVDAKGVLTVTPPSAAQLAAERDAEARVTERTAADTDLRTNAAAAMTRLDAIISGGGTYTAVEVRSAVVDLSRIQRQLLRYLATRMSG